MYRVQTLLWRRKLYSEFLASKYLSLALVKGLQREFASCFEYSVYINSFDRQNSHAPIEYYPAFDSNCITDERLK